MNWLQRAPPPPPPAGLFDQLFATSIMSYVTTICLAVAVGLAADVLSVSVRTRSQKGEVAQLVDTRYDALLEPLHSGCIFIGILSMAVRASSVYASNVIALGISGSLLRAPSSAVMFASGLSFLVIWYFLSRNAIHASARVRVFRHTYLVGDVAFRITRVFDFLSAADRVAFVRATAGVVANSSATTYVCLFAGWVVGMLQPTQSRTARLVFVSLVVLVHLVP